MTVDLITLESFNGNWNFGRVYRSDFAINGLQQVVRSAIEHSPFGYIYFFKGEHLPANNKDLISLTQRPLRIYTGHAITFPDLLSYAVPLSFFNFKPFNDTSEHSTWLISMENCLIDKSLLKSGFLDERFESLAGAGVYWAFQQLFSGAIIRQTPLLNDDREINSVPFNDQLRIVKYSMGLKWGAWTGFRLMLAGKIFSGFRVFSTLLKLKSQQYLPVTLIDHSEWRQAVLPESPQVSVLIPTVDRYPYLFKMLEQLKAQTIKPLEILVVDQTNEASRKEINMYGLPLRVFTMNEAGQCRSRNLGLQHAGGEYILFLDDDDEVYPELIEDHLRNLSFFDADVSCGLCQEPGQGEIPKHFRIIRMADIFSTNNSMVKRQVLEQSGYFDMVYDRGQKADGDLGARLYRFGFLLMMNPEIKVIHHRAPSGGLRKHNVRKVTYSSSRTHITHFRLPHVTELYFNLKNLTPLQQREYLWHSIAGTFSVRGSILKKLTKAAWALLCLPKNLFKLRRRLQAAVRIYAAYS